MKCGRKNPIIEFEEASNTKPVKNIVDNVFEKYKLAITPCTACLPPEVGEEDVNDLSTLISRNKYYYAFQTANCASLMMPICLSPTLKLPVAIQITGPKGSDSLVLQLGGFIENCLDVFKYPMVTIQEQIISERNNGKQ